MQIERKEAEARASHFTKFNGMVFLRGITAGGPDKDVSEQTRQCLSQMEAMLDEAGSSRNHILSTNIILKDMNDFGAMNEVWDSWVSTLPKPARACFQGELARPEVLVEFVVIAAEKS